MGINACWLKTKLLPAYYYGTWPCRRLGRTISGWLGKQPVTIVFYHRVADTWPSPWTISNRDFCRQLDWIVDRFEVITLEEAQRRIVGGQQTRPAVCITFDDGYAENCEQAIPELISRRLPFAYFVASNYVINGTPFPHDVACGKPLSPNTVSQLRSLANANVEIGAHTRTHCDLGKVTDPRILHDEIVGSRDDLQQIIGAPVRYFAFPYGQHSNLNPAAFQIARGAGLAGVCSAYGGYNFPGEDAFHLQRQHGDPCFWRFKSTLMLDPRVALATRRYSYISSETTHEPSHVIGHAEGGDG